MDINETLDNFLSRYYQITVMGRSIGISPDNLVLDYVASGTQNPDLMILANTHLNLLLSGPGIDDMRCIISKNQKEFLQKVVAAKGTIT